MKKYKSLIIFIIILIINTSIIIIRPLQDLDEIWNYNFANCVSKGMIPYKDFNMVPMPLLPIICSLFLNIFGNELLVMRILAIILNTVIFFLIYKILEVLNINKYCRYVVIAMLIYLFEKYMCIDYNFAVLLITLIIIYIELCENKKKENLISKCNLKTEFIIGVMAGICIAFKQSTGLAIFIGAISYKVFEIRSKIDITRFLKILLIRILGASIPIIFLIIYLIYNDAFYEFIDYCILGVKTFNNYISYKMLIKSNEMVIKILSILAPLSICIMPIISIIKKKKEIFIIWIYSLCEFVVVYPISDKIHFLIGSVPTIIGIVYVCYNILKKLNLKMIKEGRYLKYFTECAIYLMIMLAICISIKDICSYIKDCKQYIELKHFKYIMADEKLSYNIKIIDNFILNQDKPVYILDAEAAIFMIPIDKYNKKYDLFLKGNLGSKRRRWRNRKTKAE